jgi:hypothetical protein
VGELPEQDLVTRLLRAITTGRDVSLSDLNRVWSGPSFYTRVRRYRIAHFRLGHSLQNGKLEFVNPLEQLSRGNEIRRTEPHFEV